MPYQPFSMGNALAQAEGIVGQRNRNALAQQQLDPNSTANQLRRAQIEKLQREAQNSSGSTTYGKKVEYAMDADGKTLRGFAIGDDGSAKELRLPPGMTWADTYSAKDMGSFMALFGRRTGYQGGPSTDTPSPDMSDIPSATLPEQPQAQGLGGVMKTIPPEKTVEHAGAIETAKKEAAEKVKYKVQKAKFATAMKLYTGGIDSLRTALDKTVTGPFIGRAWPVTAQAQVAEQAKAMMLPILKQIVRGPGEGVFTDADALAVLALIPDRIVDEDARDQIFENMNAMMNNFLNPVDPFPEESTEGSKSVNWSDM